MSKWIAAFSLFTEFIIAQHGQGQPWSQSLLSQYDVKKFQDISGDLQAAKK